LRWRSTAENKASHPVYPEFIEGSLSVVSTVEPSKESIINQNALRHHEQNNKSLILTLMLEFVIILSARFIYMTDFAEKNKWLCLL
jgi:hypothetical protein